MGVAPLDQQLLGGRHGFPRDRLLAVRLEHLHTLPGERVDQPGLPSRELVGERDGFRLEDLPGLFRVLKIKLRHLFGAELRRVSDSTLTLNGDEVPRAPSPPKKRGMPPIYCDSPSLDDRSSASLFSRKSRSAGLPARFRAFW